MRNKSRIEVFNTILQLYPGVDIVAVSITPSGSKIYLSDWRTMLVDCNEESEPYTPGAHVTFHFADSTFVHLKF